MVYERFGDFASGRLLPRNSWLRKQESAHRQSHGRKKLGYVPEKDNQIFARLMDAGKLLKAKITKIDKKGSFYQISIGIYLVDF